MFDPISFVLVVAQQVVGTFITDFIKEKRKSANRREVESLVEQILKERGRELPDRVDVREFRGKVLNEIDMLAKQDPDLEIGRFHSLRPAKPPVNQQKAMEQQNKLLYDRMHRLDALVKQRRVSLGLPTGEPRSTAPPPPAPRPAPDTPPAALEKVDVSANNDYWARRMRETQAKIAEGRNLPDAPEDKRGK